ncbi:MAG TPA: SMP-30/gluconolactonase/LRE family protein [Devosiaceae bacterium]|jgi:sugar lactone lactonase YvrE
MNDRAELLIDSRCETGEGPFWHHLHDRLFWFDIPNRTMFSAEATGRIVDRFTFDQPVSAAAVIDKDTLAIASAGALLKLRLSTDERSVITPFEADKPGNRSNDSRMHPAGGFWIGSMSRRGDNEPGAGAVYQFRAGRLERILDQVTITNSICFSPDGRIAYFADTPTNKILKCDLDPETGLPIGEWSIFAEVDRGSPDGAVVDTEGFLWSARWGGSCVVRHAPDGREVRTIELPVSRITCPAFGGADRKTMFITTAREHMTGAELNNEPHAGGVFAIDLDVAGQTEPFLKL